MTTLGRHSATAVLSRGKSRMSAQMERTVPATSACSNKLGWVGGSSAYPVTLAPSAFSHSESQLPLKPVCPVRSTWRPFQNERLSMTRSGPPFCDPAVATEWHDRETQAESAAEQHNLHGIPPAGACCIDDACDPRVASGHRAFCSRQSASTTAPGGASTSSDESISSFETSRRNTQPS